MRISDWSSDVCSSDLNVVFLDDQQVNAIELDFGAGVFADQHLVALLDLGCAHVAVVQGLAFADGDDFPLERLFGGRVGDDNATGGQQLGRASWREECVSKCRYRW